MASHLSLYEQLGMVLHGSKVRKKIDEVANQLEARVRQLAGDGEDQAEIERISGTRPGTQSPDGIQRPFARVQVAHSWEFGTPTQERQRLLGKAISEML